jgi:hypothetical protein
MEIIEAVRAALSMCVRQVEFLGLACPGARISAEDPDFDRPQRSRP